MSGGAVRFSVVIPAYNAEGTLAETLDCVLGQTFSPHEVLVLDDGSTDTTPEILKDYAARDARVRPFRTANGGLARARNHLIARATGTHVACVDADDLWHPRFLEAHARMIGAFPQAVAWFTHHVDFVGSSTPEWAEDEGEDPGARARLYGEREFLKAYNKTPLLFHVSCFSISLELLRSMGLEPFNVAASGSDDTFIHNRLTMHGPVVQTPERLGAYRIREGSISSDQLRIAQIALKAFDELAPLFAADADPQLLADFHDAHAARQRHCGKFLMGLGRVAEARTLFRRSLTTSRSPRSLVKSAGLLASTAAPRRLQPQWPGLERRLAA